VEVHYTGRLESGEVFDSSREREPLSFQVGGGKVIAGFDAAVTGLEVGGTRTQRVPPEQAYGERNPEAVISVPKDNAPEGVEAGTQVGLSNGLTARITEVTDTEVTLDINHELAGQTLNFEVELMALTKGDSLQTATFAAGCFWGPELAFQRVPGVVSTATGYSQGDAPDVTYEQVCSGNTGHAEVVQVLYNPDEVSYQQLLEVFTSIHNPTQLNRQGGDVGTQYRSGIYTHSDEQAAAAKQHLEKLNAELGGTVVTEVEPIRNYTVAEPNHQQYLAGGGRFGQPQSPAKGCNDPIRCYG
jgi:peptide-methionine (S)-S-oxide reductase